MTTREEIEKIVLSTRDEAHGFEGIGIVEAVNQLYDLFEKEKNKVISKYEEELSWEDVAKQEILAQHLKDIEELIDYVYNNRFTSEELIARLHQLKERQ